MTRCDEWVGPPTLQFAPGVNGPWTDLPAASPFPFLPIGDKGFSRAKVDE